MKTYSVCLRSFIITVVVLLGLGGGIGSVRADSLRQSLSGDLDLRAYYNDVEGNKGNSFLTEGPGVLSDVYFYYDNTSSDTSQIQWDGLLYLQGTDDPRFEIRGDKVRLRNAYLTAERPEHWKATGGYFSENYSSFTLNSSLLGLNTSYHLSDSSRFRLFGGRDSRARPQESFRRYVYGGRFEWDPAEKNTLSLSSVRTEDDDESLSQGEAIGISPEENIVGSIEYNGQVTENLQIQAEYASSNFDSSPATDTGSADHERAAKTSLRWRPFQATELRGYYEEVDPNFTTLSGFARTDRELYQLNWNQKLSRSLSLLTEYEIWEDGLESTTTNDVTDWTVETNYTPRASAGWLKRASVFYEDRENEGETEGIDFSDNDNNDEDQYRWGADLSNEFGATDFDVGYSEERYESDSETIQQVDATLSHRFDLSVPVTYSVNGLYKTNVNEQGAGSQDAVDRTVRVSNEMFLARGRAQELRLYHRYLNEDVDNAEELVDHTIGTEFQYTLNRKIDSRLSFSCEFFDHTDKGNPNQEYQEETLELRYQTPF